MRKPWKTPPRAEITEIAEFFGNFSAISVISARGGVFAAL